jgi:hypothetical protein
MTNKIALLLIIFIIIFVPILSFAQNQQQSVMQHQYQVVKTKNNERFVLPFTAANSDRKNPIVYVYEKPKITNWILTIQNNLSYAVRQDAKAIVILKEPPPSEKFIEIAMFSDVSKKFWAAINTHDAGYIRVYERNSDGWSRDQPIIIAHANNQGLSITNGKRIIVDRLSVNGFNLGSIAVYGKDDLQSPINTYAGNISFDVAFGELTNSPIYYLPLGMLVGVGGTVVVFLVVKKRDKSQN